MSPTFRYTTKKLEGRTVVLFLHTTDKPDDVTWEAAMNDAAKHMANTAIEKIAFLVITDGGAPSTPQRKRLAEATGGKRFNLAVVNASPVIRGVITAISWFNPGIKPFAPGNWRDAVSYLGCSAAAAHTLLDEMLALQRTLDKPVACLQSVQTGSAATSSPDA